MSSSSASTSAASSILKRIFAAKRAELKAERAATPGSAYPDPTFGQTVQRMGQRFEPLWKETLRYHKNLAYLHEVEQIRQSAEWLLANSSAL